MEHKETARTLGSFGSGRGLVVGCYEHCNESPSSMKEGQFPYKITGF
jgi:hypothetical protein